jgi:hypothetical protein
MDATSIRRWKLRMQADEIRELARRQIGFPKDPVKDGIPGGMEQAVFLAEIAAQLAEFNQTLQWFIEWYRDSRRQ